MNTHFFHKNRLFGIFLILILWSIIVLPSAFNAQWGHADDGVTLARAEEGLFSSITFLHGRIYPAYLLHNWILFKIGGENPSIWYLVQSLELLITLLIIYSSLIFLTRQLWVGAFAVILFITSSPIAESYYTISKAEPVLNLFVSIMLLSLTFWIAKLPKSTKTLNILFSIISVILSILIIFAKETGILFILFYFPFLIQLLINKKRVVSKKMHAPFLTYILSFLGVSLAWLVLKTFYASTQATDYTKFYPFKYLYWNLLHYLTQSLDVLIIIILTVALGIFMIYIKRTNNIENFDCTIWALGWGIVYAGLSYFLLLLAWNQGHSYYMLPISMLFSISISLFLWVLKMKMNGSYLKNIKKAIFSLIVFIAIVSRLFSLPFIYCMATVQRNFDILEAMTRSEVYKIKSVKDRLFDMDWQHFEEPPFQNTLLFRVLWNKNFKWIGSVGLFETYHNERGSYQNPHQQNELQNNPLNDEDLVLFSNGTKPFNIVFRGIRFFEESEMKRRILILENMYGRRLKALKTLQVKTNIFEPWILRKAEFKYKKIIYIFDTLKVKSPTDFSWEGVFADHYTGGKAILKLTTMKGYPSGGLKVSIHQVPEILKKILPLSIELKGKRSMSVILTDKEREKDIPVSALLPYGNGEIVIIVKNPWSPRLVNPKSGDGRLLGPEVEYLPPKENRISF